MTSILLNGVPREIPDDAQIRTMPELIRYIHRNFTSSESILSSVLLNGSEIPLPINANEERRLEVLEIGDSDSVEVFTRNPKEFVDETLRSLIDFTQHLENCSLNAASAVGAAEFAQELARLIDGLDVFHQSLTQSKRTLKITQLGAVDLLETDLHDLLQDMLRFNRLEQQSFISEILSKHLPENLQAWRETGIPALMRSRDS